MSRALNYVPLVAVATCAVAYMVSGWIAGVHDLDRPTEIKWFAANLAQFLASLAAIAVSVAIIAWRVRPMSNGKGYCSALYASVCVSAVLVAFLVYKLTTTTGNPLGGVGDFDEAHLRRLAVCSEWSAHVAVAYIAGGCCALMAGDDKQLRDRFRAFHTLLATSSLLLSVAVVKTSFLYEARVARASDPAAFEELPSATAMHAALLFSSVLVAGFGPVVWSLSRSVPVGGSTKKPEDKSMSPFASIGVLLSFVAPLLSTIVK